MLDLLVPPVKALILDMDGVLWIGDHPIGDLSRIFSHLDFLGIKYILATNNAVRKPGAHIEKLARFGVTVQPWQVINSAMALAKIMAQEFPGGGPVYIIGEEGICTALADCGFFHQEENVLAVAAGYDRQITFEKLRRATILVRQGKPFFFTNPDKTFPTPDGLIPGAGAFLAFLEASTDVKPVQGGKPYPILYQLAIERLGLPANQVLAVGDRLDTDILGGINAGCRTALVLTGVVTECELKDSPIQPDLVAANLANLIGLRE